ncbi:ATP-binding protein [Roseococcus sp. SYP-B2431]|uniref:ATP-binding protein n=1 Tax=Roseococcus sp. SYP-B2431 TaxID=2496640 RepID=UPI0013F497E2|nr:ATP-binding protein [Roseococcus sp. SYP-B2431]
MSHARLKNLVIVATAAVLLALGVLVARLLWRGELMSVTAAEGVVTRAADVAQSLLNRHLLQVEGQITSLGELMGQDFLDVGDADRTSRALREMTAHSFTYRNLLLADTGGMVWASAVETRRGRPLAIPAAQLQAELKPDAASILGPVPHPQTGELMLVMVRRIPSGAGRPDVLAAAEIPTALITSALAPMVNPSALRIRLERADGLVLAAGPGQEELEGRRLPAPARMLAREASVVRSPNRQGGGDVFATARAIFYPGLFAVAVLPEQVALAEWFHIRQRVLGGGALIAALVLAFSAALLIALSARQRAAWEREAASRRLVDAVESLPDGFVLWDAEDRLVVCNSRYRALMGVEEGLLVPGYRYEELVRGWLARGLYRVRQPAPLEVQVATALESHRTADGYFERELADGRWLRVAKQRVAEGGTVVILCEITAARQTMAALAEARDTADRATAAKSRLLAHVSHELRTPLSSLLRLAERLGGETSLPVAQRRQAVLVGATARHLLALANEVLDIAAMEAHSLTLNLAPAPPAAIFEDALAMVQPLAEAKEVRLSFKAEGLPARIKADATRLRQMVLNLLANAVKFTPPGSTVRLDATVHSSPALLRFEVADQGPGVPESERDRLFTDFTRLAPSEAEGTGLGLSITARLAALMGGRIGCADARGGTGACFWVELPLVLAGEDRAEREPEAAPFDAGRPLRLLAVDDVPANLSVLRALLATTGFELETVTEGVAALEAAAVAAREGRPFDVVLMDVMMPGLDGIETTRRLRAMPGPAGRVPVVALTASAFPEDVAACRAAGMVAHLSKPVERGQLLRVLASLVSGRPAGGKPAGDAASEELGALRPLFLAELRKRLDQLEAAGTQKGALLEALHAIAGTVGHLGEPELVARARGVLKALQDEEPGAPEMARMLLAELRRAVRGFMAVEAAA